MNANQYRARLAEGIPPGNLTAVNMLTLKGIAGGMNVSGRNLQARTNWDQARAAYAVNLNLATSAGRPFPARTNPYAQILRSRYATPGMGDDSSDVEDSSTWTVGETTPSYTTVLDSSGQQTNIPGMIVTSSTPVMSPQPTAGSSSDWAGVLNSASSKSIFSGIGTGLARLIGGTSAAPSILPTSLTSSMPSLGTMLLLGGAVVVGGLILFRKKSAT